MRPGVPGTRRKQAGLREMSDGVDRPDQGADHRDRQEDRVTMAEAARLKGVSYHTVSRAVRRGKLPVLRLGRMALISLAALQAWQPMRERAPRKCRRAEPPSSGADPLTLTDASHLGRLGPVPASSEAGT